MFSVIRDGRLLRYADADRLNEFERRVIWRYRDRALYLQGRRNRRKLEVLVESSDAP